MEEVNEIKVAYDRVYAEAEIEQAAKELAEKEAAAKRARAEYLRAYRAANKDKVKRWNLNYWYKRALKGQH